MAGVYRETIPVSMLVRELAAVMQEFTQRGGVRPFGISLLLAGFDHNGPQLYQIDPSGSYFAWKASAIGKHMVRGWERQAAGAWGSSEMEGKRLPLFAWKACAIGNAAVRLHILVACR